MKVIRTSTIPLSLNVLLKGQLNFLSKHFDIVAVSSAGVNLDNVTIREGVKTHPIEMERGINPFKDLISLWRLYQYLKKERPSIVHSITPKAGLLTMLAGKFAGTPIRIHTFTGLIFPSRKGLTKKLLIKMDRLLCWAATNIYPEGEGVKNDLLKFKITSKPLKILANGNVNGIDLAFFDPKNISSIDEDTLRKELKTQKTDIIFCYVGRLVKDKGINELIESFVSLLVTDSTMKLLLVGDMEKELDPLLPETIQKIESTEQIISVGWQDDIRPYLAISDIFTFPSYREGFPNVVLQACAMELPCIVSDINGCNEIITHGENGEIIPVKDASSLKESMTKLLENTAYRNRLKQNTRQQIIDKYEQQFVWNELLKEYNSLLKK